MKRKQTNRAIIVLLAMALVLGCAIGGTVAWLTDKTEEVKNTFTTSDVDIELTEAAGGENKEFKMVPGATITKDPKVTVKAGSEACWLFVKIDKSENFDSFMEFTTAEAWTQGSGTIPANVYYRQVAEATADTEYSVLVGNAVTVKGEVTKEQMNNLTAETYPTLTFTAYACQQANGANTFTAAEAWAKITP